MASFLPSILLLVVLLQVSIINAFSPAISVAKNTRVAPSIISLYSNNNDDQEAAKSSTSTLEEKMKSWEASEEEIKAATLGGIVPGRSDAFDVGLYIAFPILVISCFLFLAFPFIMGSIDTSSVGPPPTS